MLKQFTQSQPHESLQSKKLPSKKSTNTKLLWSFLIQAKETLDTKGTHKKEEPREKKLVSRNGKRIRKIKSTQARR